MITRHPYGDFINLNISRSNFSDAFIKVARVSTCVYRGLYYVI
jgi:hypothetical protein